jgi:hypothetical protein
MLNAAPPSKRIIGATDTIATTATIAGPASTSTLRRGIIGTGVIGTIGITAIGEVRQHASMERGGCGLVDGSE